MIKFVRKKDNSVVIYDESKIIKAVELSCNRIKKVLTKNDKEVLLESVRLDLENRTNADIVTVDDIHISVEKILKILDYEIYNEYSRYNDYKRRFNNSFSTILKDTMNIIYNGDKENANKNSMIVSTKMTLAAELVGSELYLEYEIPKHLSKAHRNLDFYIHDTSHRLYNSINCCLFDAKNVLEGGFYLNNKFIEEPSNKKDAMEKALDLLNDIIQVGSSQQYGGFTLPELDNTLEKYVKMCWEYLEDEGYDDDEIEAILLHRAIKKFKSIQYKIECVNNATGQTPFVTWTFGTNTTKYGRLVSKAILQTRKENMAIFPKLVFLAHDDINTKPESKNYDIYKMCIKTSMNALYPDYCSANNGYLKEVYDRCGIIISPMGCRAYLSPYWDENGKERYIGRFNLGAVSLNLPRYAIMSNGNEKIFFSLIDKYFEYAIDVHKYTYEKMRKVKAKSNPLLFMEGGSLLKLKANDVIEPLLKSCTYSIGYIGLTEVSYLMTGKHLHEDNGFAKKILEYLNEKIEKAKKETNMLIALYATPSEGLCDKFCRDDRDKFGVIKHVTDKKWYHNSFHVDSGVHINAIEKQKIESELFHLSNGGHIVYNEFPNVDNFEGYKAIIDNAMKLGLYFGVNKEISTCNTCGHQGDFLGKCPNCNSKDVNTIDRVCGYLGWRQQNGETRYNEGKTAEVDQRSKHFDIIIK